MIEIPPWDLSRPKTQLLAKTPKIKKEELET